ncbi:MAG TPA: substrate-binding domain-containing protein [Burkholderiales bacterium]|jgi:molybdate transport system substrate-binding protein
MEQTLIGISSKATGPLLAELARTYETAHGRAVKMESVGGVDAARRVAEGEAFDVVVLEGAQIAKQVAAGRVVAGSERAMVHSRAMVAVRAGAARPPVGTLKEFQDALLAARAVGYSTGPSGVILLKMIEDWGLKDKLGARMVQAPPGKPVGALLAEGAVDVGIQQYSELMNLPGVDILGPLPPGAEINSVFTASVCAASKQPEEARRLVEYLASPAIAETKRRQGFEPA